MEEIILSPFAQKVKKYYDLGLWNYEAVENVFKQGKITEEEFNEITKAN